MTCPTRALAIENARNLSRYKPYLVQYRGAVGQPWVTLAMVYQGIFFTRQLAGHLRDTA